MAVEKRSATRRRTLKAARMIFNKGASTLDCTLRNLSDTGAAIEGAITIGVPEEFDLVLLADKSVYRCHVVWRSIGRLGDFSAHVAGMER
jgi:hypothetical protein